MRITGALVRKELLLEWRTKESVPAMALFSLTTFVIFHFALDPLFVSQSEKARAKHAEPGHSTRSAKCVSPWSTAATTTAAGPRSGAASC